MVQHQSLYCKGYPVFRRSHTRLSLYLVMFENHMYHVTNLQKWVCDVEYATQGLLCVLLVLVSGLLQSYH